ncbi:invertebrate-type lysozyme 3-like [Macrosteles quadrilineatus]|uniref:invertebrate-type lysozyme 3-like n=1 Tax=Macrosteles quadrilineatus TaxID=74068 RepID=UPI0023E2A6F7|nr:invertebrate-type lysozyme 3-like [Macrosteles quadrilineatus]
MASTHCCICVLVCVVVSVSALLLEQPDARNVFLPDFTEDCVACICDASSACNLTIGCFAGLCGPFLIGRQYWLDAGAPVLPGATWQSKNAYESCTMDPNCATSTIFNYMTRFARDCNGDGQISCDDYARIHYLGGNQCSVPIKNYAYYRIFQQCNSRQPPQAPPL